MTLQQRIQQSATELGRLLRQAEKNHRRFIKRRDGKMQGIKDSLPPDKKQHHQPVCHIMIQVDGALINQIMADLKNREI